MIYFLSSNVLGPNIDLLEILYFFLMTLTSMLGTQYATFRSANVKIGSTNCQFTVQYSVFILWAWKPIGSSLWLTVLVQCANTLSSHKNYIPCVGLGGAVLPLVVIKTKISQRCEQLLTWVSHCHCLFI